jgi:hypothetical protein
MPMTAGTTYWIRVAGTAGNTGVYELSIHGGLGVCDHRRDAHWFPQLPGALSIMKDAWSGNPHRSPWADMHLGFTRPLIVEEDGTYVLHRAETIRSSIEQIEQPEAIVIPNEATGDISGEYFVLENRAPLNLSGTATIDEGIALWLVHENPFPGDGNMDARRAVQLIRPQVWAGDTDSLWDGAQPDCYDLSAYSSPKNTHWADGTPSYLEILNISEAGPTMAVDIRLPGVFVDQANSGPEHGTPEEPYDTVSEGVMDVGGHGRNLTIRIAPGAYPLDDGQTFQLPCTLVNWTGSGDVYIGQ